MAGHVGTAASMPAVAAHRGWHADGAAENSIAALERAVYGGADRIELDVRVLGDGTLVVHHDATIAGTPLQQLDRSVLRSHPQIATLDDWARRAGELGATALTEIKGSGHEAATLATLRRHLPPARIELMGFDPKAVQELRRLAPRTPVGLLTDLRFPAVGPARLVDDARRVGASFLGLNVRQATEPVLAAAHAAGLGVGVWTVDRSDDLARLLADPRVHTVISDAPARALAMRAGMHDANAAVRLLPRVASLVR